MVQPYVGEVRLFGGNFAPVGWALCNGQSLSISTNTALYALLGTIYGGDGVTTFNLPNMQGRLCVGMGQGPGLSNYVIGQVGGNEMITLSVNQMPMHTHMLSATTTTANQGNAGGNLTGKAPSGDMYTSGSPTLGLLGQNSTSMAGGSQPHSNLMPSVCVSYIIALVGIYPSQN
ncbi:MAG TPA: tail fiber protein [Xanthobacteraceae bacterium]|jgi:microcystin-dependent protein|nr:tail fiber protein [Xanthobacteraceae bacterium]